MFLYTGESVHFNKNAHCFAVEPSRLTLRFRCKHLRFAIASRRSFRLPPGTPKNNRNCGCFCIRGSPCVLIKTHTALQLNPQAGASLSMQASSLRYFVALLLPTPPPGTPSRHTQKERIKLRRVCLFLCKTGVNCRFRSSLPFLLFLRVSP